jgi:hypothetical protein
MKIVRLLWSGVFLSAALVGLQTSFAQGTNTTNNVTGQWDFNQGDLRATIGTPLQFVGGIEGFTTFENAQIGGATAKVMHFPGAEPGQGYLMFHGAKPNGGGTNVNEYTLIMDLMWPGDSDGTFRALFNVNTNDVDDPNDITSDKDAAMFVNPDNAIGIQNDYIGTMNPNTWYRLGLAFDLTNGIVTKYLNGTNIGSQFLGANLIDSPQFSLGPALLLFADNSFETAPGLVNSVQFRDRVLTDAEMLALGSPSAGGIGGGSGGGGGDIVIQSIKKTGTTVTITVTGGTGNLVLQKKTKLPDPTWQNVTNSTSGTFTVTSTNSTAFFRVQQ